jgi:hypothetical protein
MGMDENTFWGSADLRTAFMPDSEGIERTATKLQKRNFPSVEQIQDSPPVDNLYTEYKVVIVRMQKHTEIEAR